MTAGLEPDVDHGRWVLVQILLRIELEWDIEGTTFRRGMLGKMYAERLSNVSVGSWVIFVETFRKQRETFFFSSLSAKRNALRPILHGGKSRFRIQGTAI